LTLLTAMKLGGKLERKSRLHIQEADLTVFPRADRLEHAHAH